MKKINLIILILLQISCVNKKSSDDVKIEDSVDLKKDTIAIISKPTATNPIGKIENLHFGCGFNNDLNKPDLNLSMPNQREIDEIQNILSYSGIPLNFEIYSANIENAVATIINNKRYIIYDPKLLAFASKNSNEYWSSISILAHEIGHHLSGHTMKNDIESHKRELEADKFSGFILYKMGAKIEQATNTIYRLGSEEDTQSHPSKYKRIEAIENGWNEANRQRYMGAVPPSINDDPNSFCEYNVDMLISSEYRELENANIWYGEYKFITGVITEVDKNFENFQIRIFKTSKKFKEDFRSIDGEDWTIEIDQKEWDNTNEMSHSCSMNFKYLIVPGRRLKFAITEGYPGCGTAMNGVWFLTYAKAIDNNSL
nr:M48 family metalloprotease [uncultured Flavobacterium sp.]